MASKQGKGNGKSCKLDKYIDYRVANSMRVSDNDHLFEEAVRALPGLSSRLVFHKSGPKVKQKAKGKGLKRKIKSIEKKGQGKGAFSGNTKGKSKGKKGAWKAFRKLRIRSRTFCMTRFNWVSSKGWMFGKLIGCWETIR